MKVKRVTRIRLAAPVPVYDLTVDGTENFALASGVFVHNSKDISDAVAGAVFNAGRDRTIRLDMGVDTEYQGPPAPVPPNERPRTIRRNITRR